MNPSDLKDLSARGMSSEEVERQEFLLRAPPPPPAIDRPCTLGDGIIALPREDASNLAQRFNDAREAGRLSRFVPASGAATRMFRAAAAWRRKHAEPDAAALAQDAAAGDADAIEVQSLLEGLPRLAFQGALREALRGRGQDLDALLSSGRVGAVLDALLGEGGLASQPKALTPFHRTGAAVRTPLEEHLVEAAETLRDGGGLCRVHFTVAPEHEAAIRAAAAEAAARVEKARRVRYDLSFSTQHPSTDTVALEADGSLARRPDGRILFRPGGHGALLRNLARAGGDIVFIKNIDNVGHESRPGEGSHWDAMLAGLLLDLQFHLHQRLAWLATRPNDERLLSEIEEFSSRRLNLRPPWDPEKQERAVRREWLLSRLARPLRVCAVVRNTGEPGGGPFWVRGADGDVTAQILESAQVSPDPDQRRKFAAATHFNPVHMVCALRDPSGNPFDLEAFADPRAVFIAEKSVDGKPLRVLERPGLWNGGMARWTTVFVEAPVSVFHPVKSAVDLLRPDHQPT